MTTFYKYIWPACTCGDQDWLCEPCEAQSFLAEQEAAAAEGWQ
jgi:hypothetical protein